MSDPSKPAARSSLESGGVAEIEAPAASDRLVPDGAGLIPVQVYLMSGGRFAIKVELYADPVETPPVNAQEEFHASNSHVLVTVPVPGGPGSGVLACEVRVWGWDGSDYLTPSAVAIEVDWS